MLNWNDLGGPAMLILLALIIALATLLLSLLFPPIERASPTHRGLRKEDGTKPSPSPPRRITPPGDNATTIHIAEKGESS